MNKELVKKVYESKLVVNCENYEELIQYLDFLSEKGCESVLDPIDEIKETTILDLWNKLFKSICVRIDKGIIKYIHFNNIRFYKNLMGEDSVITYKELMKEEINVENAVFKDLQEVGTQGKKVSNALKNINKKLSNDDTEEFKKFENAMNETKKMIESKQYKRFIEQCKNESKKVPFGVFENMNSQNCKCYIESVNHPTHYNKGIEAIEYIESHNFNFNLGNAVKYITRCEHKGNKKEDIEKAIWYLQREIDKL